VLVEGAGQALTTMAAYIDLNPVRAGIVQDPKDYRWSGYGEAVAGKRGSRLGIQTLVTALQRGREESVSRSLEVYRSWLYREGDEEREATGEDGRRCGGGEGDGGGGGAGGEGAIAVGGVRAVSGAVFLRWGGVGESGVRGGDVRQHREKFGKTSGARSG
jgi:hypothetical protein